jgi:hypothetical protein
LKTNMVYGHHAVPPQLGFAPSQLIFIEPSHPQHHLL